MSLTDYYDKLDHSREESRRRTLEHNAEIKISESVLKVEMINFHKQKRYILFIIIITVRHNRRPRKREKHFYYNYFGVWANDQN